jgi:ubiquinone/menaquinone biosynthesis C-methylase UbiE
MLRALLRLGFALPKPVAARILPTLWRAFWERERQNAERETKSPVPVLSRSERAVLVQRICEYYPVESLLEIGVGYAQNFHILGPLLPDTKLVGVDTDSGRMQSGQEYLIEKGVMNGCLLHGNATNLYVFPDASFDLVISCGFLLYLRQGELLAALREAVRVARKGVLLVEQHQNLPRGAQEFSVPGVITHSEKPYWVHDFVQAFSQAAPKVRVNAVAVAGPVWSTEQWRTHAHLIVADVSNYRSA